MQNIQDFLNSHNLILNENKRKYISFKTAKIKQDELLIKINKKEIKKENKLKFVGLIIDDILNWNYSKM